jgi:hypothetical protein
LSTTKILAIHKQRVQPKTKNKQQQPTITPSGVMVLDERSKTTKEQDGEEEEEQAWVKCFGAAPQEEWIRFRRQVEYKSKEEEQQSKQLTSARII